MKIIVAPDSFKGSLTAVQAAEAMQKGIFDCNPAIETILLPAADGGEGTMSSLVGATEGKLMTVWVQDPLGRKIEANYGVLGDNETCVIEIAEASGLMRLSEMERNPLITSSFGTGELMNHALNKGYRKFIIGLGGSATNDGGTGMLQALGMRFLNDSGHEVIPVGGTLGEIATIDLTNFDKRILESHFLIACDVKNPFIGPNGASAIFGPQKGATTAMVEYLDYNLHHFANIIKELNGVSLHNQEGAGAAGGAGGAFQAFFPGEMKQGINVVLEAISFHEVARTADLIITGEGKSDNQTFSGKTPIGIAEVAKELGKPVILISGVVAQDLLDKFKTYFDEVHAVVGKGIPVEESIKEAANYLRQRTKKVVMDFL